MVQLRQFLATLDEVRKLIWEKKIDFIAASITYYAFFSMVPLLLLGFIVLSVYTGETVAREMILGISVLLPSVAERIITDVLQQNIVHAEATVVGLVVLLWASLQLFRAFDIAFSQIYGTPIGEHPRDEIRDAMTSLFTLSVAVVITAGAGAILSAFPHIELVGAIWITAQFVGLTIIFLPLYHVFTDVPFNWRQLLPGAMLAAAGWTALQGLFQFYTAYVGGSIYDGFGGLLLLILWMYIGNILLLIGAIVNLVHAEHEGFVLPDH